MDSADSTRLLALTASEVKRLGGSGPTLVHLAEVLRQHWPDAFADTFTDDDKSRLAALIRRKAWVGNGASVSLLVSNAQDIAALAAAVRAALAESLSDAAPAPTAQPAQTDPSDGQEAAPAPAPIRRSYGLDAPAPVALRTVEPRTITGRAAEVEAAASALGVARRRPVAVVGAPGSGRTAFLGAVAAELARRGDPRPVRLVGPSDLTWRPDNVWLKLTDTVTDETVLCVDDFDEAGRLATAMPSGEFLVQVAATRRHPHLTLLLVCTPQAFERLENLHADLAGDLLRVDLPPLPEPELDAVVAAGADALAAFHEVTITDAARKAACTAPRPSDRRGHPGLALDRLDAAASRARHAGRDEVPADLVETNALDDHTPSRDRLAAALSERVKGQGEAIRILADRLALTTASLDLRPERPDGVFLFVGPTGVGKTELARALADVLCGGPEALIRLDMSEYAHDWSVSRITGPAPGYVGSDDPSSWLTTKVIARPRSVVLLDEIEKAHPAVWNTFLQAFDVGRLTDGRGTVADLSRVVFVMTSNLGVTQAVRAAVGFGNAGVGGLLMSHAEMAARVMTVVNDRMAPELLNRMDDVIVFNALTANDIADIARLELDRIRQRLSDRGRVVEYGAGVAEYLADKGYDPAYGARHLLRSIEKHLLSAIAQSGGTAVRINVDGDRLVAEQGA